MKKKPLVNTAYMIWIALWLVNDGILGMQSIGYCAMPLAEWPWALPVCVSHRGQMYLFDHQDPSGVRHYVTGQPVLLVQGNEVWPNWNDAAENAVECAAPTGPQDRSGKDRGWRRGDWT